MKRFLLIPAVAALLSLPNYSVRGQDAGALLDLLEKKKVITRQEAEEVRADLVKAYTATPAGKINISSPVKELRIYGDTRLRYEYREAQSQSNHSDSASMERFRYRLRLGLDAKLADNWFFGVRVETGSGARSTNVTMSQTGGGQAFSKTNNTIYVGQLYVKNTPFPWLTLTGGKMPNPLVTTGMVWDPDINPEGFAQQFKYTFGPFNGADHTVADGKGGKSVVTPGEPGQFTLDVFANVAELVYDTAAVTGTGQNAFGTIASSNDTFLFALQAGAKANFNKTTFLQVAPTFYFYSGTRNADYNGPKKTYSGVPGGNQTGINNLNVFEIPIEFDWVMAGMPFRLFGDFAYNLDAAARARAAASVAKVVYPKINSFSQEDIAWQVGLAMNKIKRKGDWELMAYWQSSGQYAVDPNLIEDDTFDAHLNMQGPVFKAGYALTDAVTINLAYNYGRIMNGNLGTGGAGGTMNGSTSNPAEHSYNLLQVDLNLKF